MIEVRLGNSSRFRSRKAHHSSSQLGGRRVDVVDLEADVEVDVVQHDLDQPGQRQQPGRHLPPPRSSTCAVPGRSASSRLRTRSARPLGGGVQVDLQLQPGAAGSRPRSRRRAAPARRTSSCRSPVRAHRRQPAQRVGLPGDVGGDMAAAPVGQPARRPPVLVGDRDRVAEQPLRSRPSPGRAALSQLFGGRITGRAPRRAHAATTLACRGPLRSDVDARRERRRGFRALSVGRTYDGRRD